MTESNRDQLYRAIRAWSDSRSPENADRLTAVVDAVCRELETLRAQVATQATAPAVGTWAGPSSTACDDQLRPDGGAA